jgi:type II secretion system protein G
MESRQMRAPQIRRAFTLIELLVVVAIIALLAAIALPNFLEAQTRARVARVRADLRTLITGLEIYRTDFNRYPPASGVGIYAAPIFSNPVHQRLIPLTTPISYLSSLPPDPYPPTHMFDGSDADLPLYTGYDYVDADNRFNVGSGLTSGGAWRLCSAGPDRGMAYGGAIAGNNPNNPPGVDYDPTNGTLSAGDLVRVGATAPTPGGAPDDLNNPFRPGILRTPYYREQWQ